GYARPQFLRIRDEIEITGTFKHRKVEAVEEGFDPDRVSEPLFSLDAKIGAYVPLDGVLYERIQAGDVRF
ncbi:MAG: long-chain-acyl-CoA synthetase, partial [bacterium]|nr:long-chain-acyl-CoA synthetase [bacterium]